MDDEIREEIEAHKRSIKAHEGMIDALKRRHQQKPREWKVCPCSCAPQIGTRIEQDIRYIYHDGTPFSRALAELLAADITVRQDPTDQNVLKCSRASKAFGKALEAHNEQERKGE